MKSRVDSVLTATALLAAVLVWTPFFTGVLALILVLGLATIMPGRAFFPDRTLEVPAAAFSLLLVAAGAWVLSIPLGDPALAARISFTIAVVAGAAMSMRRKAATRPAPLPPPAALMLLVILFALLLTTLLNPSLLTRTEARLFLPLTGAMQSGGLPPTNPFLVGAPVGQPWMFAAFIAPFRPLTRVPAPVLVLTFQAVGILVLLAGAWRWAELRGGRRWAGFVLPAILVGGLTLAGFRNLPGLVDLEGPGLSGAPLLRAMTGLAGDPTVAGLLARAWGVSGLIWSLGLVSAAGALSEEPRFRWQRVTTGLLLGSAVLLHPATGIAAVLMWSLLHLAGGRGGHGTFDGSASATLVALLVAAAVSIPYLIVLPAPFAEIPLTLARTGAPARWRPLFEALPLFLLAGAALAARRDRRGWVAALAVGALWGFLASFSPAPLFGFLWASLLFAGIPAALGLERLARRHWGTPLTVAMVFLLLATPAALVASALADRTGETRWSAEERAMFARVDRRLPGDAVVLTLPTTRATSEELVLLPRAAYLGPTPSANVFRAARDTASARLAERREQLVIDFARGRNPVAVIDRIAEQAAPRPLAFVISSEDAALHRDVVENIYPTAFRFRPLENSETLKILLYEKQETGPAHEAVPPKPRIILRPDATGTLRADTIGVIVDSTVTPAETTGAAADSTGGPAGAAETP